MTEYKKNNKIMKNNIEGWVFIFNSYTNTWRSTNRDNYTSLWNGPDDSIIESREMSTLIDIITINDGNIQQVIEWKKEFYADIKE